MLGQKSKSVSTVTRPGSDETLAIKCHAKVPDDAGGLTTSKRCRDELSVLSALRERPHPHLMYQFAVSEEVSHVSIMMPFGSGGDLMNAMTSAGDGALDVATVQTWFGALVHAVQHLHELGWAHGDICPDNIVLFSAAAPFAGVGGGPSPLPPWSPVLLDYDSAYQFTGIRPGRASSSADNRSWTAVEVLQGLDYDPALAEAFSLGVLLFCMLTNHLPYSSPSSYDRCFDLLSKCMLTELLNSLGVLHRVPAEVFGLLDFSLQTRPYLRASVAEIARHPWVVQGMLRIGLQPPGPLSPPAPLPVRPPSPPPPAVPTSSAVMGVPPPVWRAFAPPSLCISADAQRSVEESIRALCIAASGSSPHAPSPVGGGGWGQPSGGGGGSGGRWGLGEGGRPAPALSKRPRGLFDEECRECGGDVGAGIPCSCK